MPAVIIAYATTGQLPTYGETRRQTMGRWIMEVLTELKMETWEGIFRVTNLSHAQIYQTPCLTRRSGTGRLPTNPYPCSYKGFTGVRGCFLARTYSAISRPCSGFAVSASSWSG